MRAFSNILETIGRTPQVKLNKMTSGMRASVYAKLEYFNPGGSVKDRIALNMLNQAEEAGLINPDTTIIEATAGNTGIGLALVAAVKGYRCVFVMPDKMSCDKISLLRGLGAQVIVTPTAVPPDSPENYNMVADRLTREIANSWRPNQFENLGNPEAHYLTTGPEIWEDLDGRVDVFVAGVGTGGTVSGIGRYLREQNPEVKIVVADPAGSVLSGGDGSGWKVEGIGEDFFPDTFDKDLVDRYITVTDEESFRIARELAKNEGMLVGGSAGTAAAAALTYAAELTEPANVVVLMPDTARNYLSKIFCAEWLTENGFTCPELEASPEAPAEREGAAVATAGQGQSEETLHAV